MLVATLAVGICGTDREIAAGRFGAAPGGTGPLVLGHELLGQILTAPSGCGVVAGQLVTAVVRRPDPDPCRRCAAGRWDLCTDGRFTEHGITGRHGFLRPSFRTEPDALVPLPWDLADVGVLVEPASVVTRAWSEIEAGSSRLGGEGADGARVLVTGSGPIGLLALLAARQRGHEATLLDRSGSAIKRALAERLGARVHTGIVEGLGWRPDVVIEATGDAWVVRDAVHLAAPGAVVCLLGLAHGGPVPLEAGALNNHLVHANKTVTGSVNAARVHYTGAVDLLASAPAGWLDALITRRVPLRDAARALDRSPGEIKTVVAVQPPVTAPLGGDRS